MIPAMPTTESIKVAVHCNNCKRIVAYKLCKGSGILQVKCPKCGCEIRIDLSLRRTNYPVFYRTATIPLSIPMK